MSSLNNLEKIVNGDGDIRDANWPVRYPQLLHQICRIEVLVPEAVNSFTPTGTGFLIGPDLVMTNYHVLDDVINWHTKQYPEKKKTPPKNIRFRFDFHDGAVTDREGSYLLAEEDWLLASSPPSPVDAFTETEQYILPTLNQLDYALVRLSGSPGNDNITTQRRGWITLPEQPAVINAGDTWLVLQHPHGETLKFDKNKITKVNKNNTRVLYKINTAKGSSGSPCFFHQNLELTALHQAGDPAEPPQYNQGIPIAVIIEDLKQKGMDEKWFKQYIVTVKPPISSHPTEIQSSPPSAPPRLSWISTFSPITPILPDSTLSSMLNGYSPFPELTAENELPFLFGETGAFWAGHPIYRRLSANFTPEAIISEPGMGRSAFARALIQVGSAGGVPLNKTLPIFISGYQADWEAIKSEIAEALLEYSTVNLPHIFALHPDQQKFLVEFLVGNLGETQVRAGLQQAFPPEVQADEIPNDQVWPRKVDACLQMLKLERIVLAFDFSLEDGAQFKACLKLIPRWRDNAIIPKLFLPEELVPQKGRLKVTKLTWNNNQLQQMAEWRFDSLSRLTNSRLTLAMLFESEELYPKFIDAANGSPRRLAELWQALFNDHLTRNPNQMSFSEENLNRAVEQLKQ